MATFVDLEASARTYKAFRRARGVRSAGDLLRLAMIWSVCHFTAVQASRRSGVLECRLAGDRVLLSGTCFTTIEGSFQL